MANSGWCRTYSITLFSSFASDLYKTVGQALRLRLNCQASKYFWAPGPGCICRLHLTSAHMVKPWHTPFPMLWFPQEQNLTHRMERKEWRCSLASCWTQRMGKSKLQGTPLHYLDQHESWKTSSLSSFSSSLRRDQIWTLTHRAKLNW